jgi:hypothetical protein
MAKTIGIIVLVNRGHLQPEVAIKLMAAGDLPVSRCSATRNGTSTTGPKFPILEARGCILNRRCNSISIRISLGDYRVESQFGGT